MLKTLLNLETRSSKNPFLGFTIVFVFSFTVGALADIVLGLIGV